MRQLIACIGRLAVGVYVILVAALLAVAGLLLFAPRLLLRILRVGLSIGCIGAALFMIVGVVRGLIEN